jgi:sugar (pentulose or hexulose) kinase
VSNFLCSLLVGRLTPIEHADAAGMNLLDVVTKQWNLELFKLVNVYSLGVA